jgi:hypothetical protein
MDIEEDIKNTFLNHVLVKGGLEVVPNLFKDN